MLGFPPFPLTLARLMQQKDLIGGRLFWCAAGATLAGLIVAAAIRHSRAWIGLALLVMWTAFSLVNAVRARRVHSIVSAPVYFAAALVFAAVAAGRTDVQIWLIWLIGGGLIAANLSERLFGRYL